MFLLDRMGLLLLLFETDKDANGWRLGTSFVVTLYGFFLSLHNFKFLFRLYDLNLTWSLTLFSPFDSISFCTLNFNSLNPGKSLDYISKPRALIDV